MIHGCREVFTVPAVLVPVKVVEGFGISRVVVTNDEGFRPGDLVSGMTGWEEYTLITSTDRLRKIEADEKIPLSYHLGLLGQSNPSSLASGESSNFSPFFCSILI